MSNIVSLGTGCVLSAENLREGQMVDIDGQIMKVTAVEDLNGIVLIPVFGRDLWLYYLCRYKKLFLTFASFIVFLYLIWYFLIK